MCSYVALINWHFESIILTWDVNDFAIYLSANAYFSTYYGAIRPILYTISYKEINSIDIEKP